MSNNTKQIPIGEAKNKQLRNFASGHLGLPVGVGVMNDKALRALIAKAWDKPYIVVPVDESLEVEPRTPAPPAEVKLGDEPYVTLEIHVGEEDDGKDMVFTAVNGRAMYIPRGEEVSIKYRYYLALKNAQKMITDQRGEGVHTEDVRRIVQQYPFNVIAMPSRAAIDAWLAADAQPASRAA